MKSGDKVIVIGGGIIGLSTAYYAQKAGFEVTLVDQGNLFSGNCSDGNAGMIVPSHFIPLAAPGMVSKGLRMLLNPESPFFIRPQLDLELIRWCLRFASFCTPEHVAQVGPMLRDLNLASRQLYAQLAETEDFGLEKRGLLMLCNTQQGLDNEAATAIQAQKIGLQANILNAAETATLDPTISMNIRGAVHYPEDCHLAPHRFISLLYKKTIEMGGKILPNTEVQSLHVKQQQVRQVSTSEGDLSTDQVILCGGASSTDLLRPLGIKLPLQAGKGYSLTLNDPPDLPKICSIFSEGKVAITPIEKSLRAAGTMEIGKGNNKIAHRRVNGIIKTVCNYFPNFSPNHFASTTPWVGLRPVTPDGLPYLGRSSTLHNLIISTGHAMMGVSLAPITGKLTAEILAHQPTSLPISILSPTRFSRPKIIA